jgi:hypothetical protein
VEMSNETREMTGIALPLATRSSSPVQRIATSWAIPVPPMQTLPLFAAAVLFMLMDAVPASALDSAKGIEIGEMLFGLGALVTAAMFGQVRNRQTNSRAIRAITLTLFVSLLIVQFGPSKQLLLQRERRLTEFRDWRYANMSLLHPAEHLIETDIALKRYAGVLGTSSGASYNRLLLLSKPKRAETIARLADSRAQEDLILASINAAITSGYLDKDDTKRQRLKEAEQLVDQQLADGAPTANLIVLKATVICLQEGAKPALSFLRSRRAMRPLAGFQRANALGFINQRNCAK